MYMYLFGNAQYGPVDLSFGTGPIDQVVMIRSNPVMAHARRDMKSITSSKQSISKHQTSRANHPHVHVLA